MNNNQPSKDRIFETVVEMADAELRARKLDELCGNDSQLKDEILDLLSRDEKMGSFLEAPPTDFRLSDTDTEPDQSEAQAPEIPNYRVIRVIGQGGMGTVWLAEQERPVRRQVALKLVRSDSGGQQVITRFEAERQALALMDHPNIAKVLEAGTTSQGSPYFVMELVDGTPLNKFCDEQKLNIHDRLKLFVQVCKAVGHAHQKGIVHRDLKPSNILVGLMEGQAVAKVIDFGLAKATRPEFELTEDTLHTEFGRVVGTIQYMSPEQANSNSRDIDTRSDIYSLGVMLFELLTGSTPLRKELVNRSNLLDLLELLRESGNSERPSDRIQADGMVNEIGDRRKIAPNRLQNILRGELDWIVMKALEHERDRRYETVNALGDDVSRFMNVEPVFARPPSTSYRIRKFVEKNRGWVVAASTVIFLLIAGTIGTSAGFYQASRNADAEREAKELAIEQKQLADRKSKEAEIAAEESSVSAERSAEALYIFASAFESVDPASGSDADMDAREVLSNASRLLQESELDDEGRAILLRALSTAFLGVGDFQSAAETAKNDYEIRKSFSGKSDLETIKSLSNWGYALRQAGKFNESLPLLTQAMELAQTEFGDRHFISLTATNNLCDLHVAMGRSEETIPILQKAIDTAKSLDDPFEMELMNGLAGALRASGKAPELLELLGNIIELAKNQYGDDHPKTLVSTNNLAQVLCELGRRDEAIPMLEELHEKMGMRLGADHPDTLNTANNLGDALVVVGRTSDGIAILESNLGIAESKLGGKHPMVFSLRNNLSLAYQQVGDFQKAIGLQEDLLKARESVLAEGHPDVIVSQANLAALYRKVDRWNDARPLYESAVKQAQSFIGPDHPMTLSVMGNAATAFLSNGENDRAIELLKEVIEKIASKPGHDRTDLLMRKYSLASCYIDMARYENAISILEETSAGLRKLIGPEQFYTQLNVFSLGRAYKLDGQTNEAVLHLVEAWQASAKLPRLAGVKKHLREVYLELNDVDGLRELHQEIQHRLIDEHGEDSEQLAGAQIQAGADLVKVGAPEHGERMLRAGWKYRHRQQPESWLTFNAQSLLGEAVLVQERFAAAKELLIPAYEGLQESADSIPEKIREQRLSEARERVSRLARASGDEELLDYSQVDGR